MAPPAKKARLLEDSSSEESGSEVGSRNGASKAPMLKINSEYAERFEHNKKREELHRCEYSPPDYYALAHT